MSGRGAIGQAPATYWSSQIPVGSRSVSRTAPSSVRIRPGRPRRARRGATIVSPATTRYPPPRAAPAGPAARGCGSRHGPCARTRWTPGSAGHTPADVPEW